MVLGIDAVYSVPDQVSLGSDPEWEEWTADETRAFDQIEVRTLCRPTISKPSLLIEDSTIRGNCTFTTGLFVVLPALLFATSEAIVQLEVPAIEY